MHKHSIDSGMDRKGSELNEIECKPSDGKQSQNHVNLNYSNYMHDYIQPHDHNVNL